MMNLRQINEWLIIISAFVAFVSFILVLVRILQGRKKIVGRASIDVVTFTLAKLFLGVPILVVILNTLGLELTLFRPSNVASVISVILLLVGEPLLVLSILNLNQSTRIGLPLEETTLKTDGIYKLSRNPMYLGVYMLSAASALYVMNDAVWMFLIFGIIVHHKIILEEEKFLLARFENEYSEYCKKVGRYLRF